MTMTDYIKQVADAVRDAALRSYFDHAFTVSPIDLGVIIAQVPKPDPAIWMRPDELQKVKVSPYLCHGWNERDKQSDAIPLYTYPPDARAEIEYLKCAVAKHEALAKAAILGMEIAQRRAAKREAFIEQLMANRHAELMQVANLMAWAPGSDCERVVDQVEQDRRE